MWNDDKLSYEIYKFFIIKIKMEQSNEPTAYALNKHIRPLFEDFNSYSVVDRLVENYGEKILEKYVVSDGQPTIFSLRGTEIYLKEANPPPIFSLGLIDFANGLKPQIPNFVYLYNGGEKKYTEIHEKWVPLQKMMKKYDPSDIDNLRKIWLQIYMATFLFAAKIEHEWGEVLMKILTCKIFVVRFDTPKLICYKHFSFFSHFVPVIDLTSEGKEIHIRPDVINELFEASVYKMYEKIYTKDTTDTKIESGLCGDYRELFNDDEIIRTLEKIKMETGVDNEGAHGACETVPWKTGKKYVVKNGNIGVSICLNRKDNELTVEIPENLFLYVGDEKIFQNNSYYPIDGDGVQVMDICTKYETNWKGYKAVYTTVDEFNMFDIQNEQILEKITKKFLNHEKFTLYKILMSLNDQSNNVLVEKLRDIFSKIFMEKKDYKEMGNDDVEIILTERVLVYELQILLKEMENYDKHVGFVFITPNVSNDVKFYFFRGNLYRDGKNQLIERQFFNGKDWQVIETILRKKPSDTIVGVKNLNDYKKKVWAALFARKLSSQQHYLSAEGVRIENDISVYSDEDRKKGIYPMGFYEATAFILKSTEFDKIDTKMYEQLGLFEYDLLKFNHDEAKTMEERNTKIQLTHNAGKMIVLICQLLQQTIRKAIVEYEIPTRNIFSSTWENMWKYLHRSDEKKKFFDKICDKYNEVYKNCLLYTSPSPRD